MGAPDVFCNACHVQMRHHNFAPETLKSPAMSGSSHIPSFQYWRGFSGRFGASHPRLNATVSQVVLVGVTHASDAGLRLARTAVIQINPGLFANV